MPQDILHSTCHKSCKLLLKGFERWSCPSCLESFSSLSLLGSIGIFCAPQAKAAPAGWLVWCRAPRWLYHRSDPFSVQEQDQLVPKPFTTDVCLSSYSKTNKKWQRCNSFPSQSILCLIILTIRNFFHVYPKSLLWLSKPIISHPIIKIIPPYLEITSMYLKTVIVSLQPRVF